MNGVLRQKCIGKNDHEPKVILQRNEGECSKGWNITETMRVNGHIIDRNQFGKLLGSRERKFLKLARESIRVFTPPPTSTPDPGMCISAWSKLLQKAAE